MRYRWTRVDPVLCLPDEVTYPDLLSALTDCKAHPSTRKRTLLRVRDGKMLARVGALSKEEIEAVATEGGYRTAREVSKAQREERAA